MVSDWVFSAPSASPSQGHRWDELRRESLTGGFFCPSQGSGLRRPPLLFRTSPRVHVSMSRPHVSSFTFTPLFKGSTLLGTGSREALKSPLFQNPPFLKLHSVQLCPAPREPCLGNCADHSPALCAGTSQSQAEDLEHELERWP